MHDNRICLAAFDMEHYGAVFELAYPNEDVLSRAGAIAYYLFFFFVFYFITFLIIWKRKVFIDFDIISPSTMIATLVVLVVSLILSEK